MKTPVKILLVDDDVDHLTLLEHILLQDGQYRVLKATGVKEALHVAERQIPSLIVSDYYMPDGDGFSFCKMVKAHPGLYDTMFMLLSVASEPSKKIEGLDLGADDYLVKPVNEEEFLARVNVLLRIKSLQEELKNDAKQLEELNAELEKGFLGTITLMTHLIGLRVPNAAVRGQRAAQIVEWMSERLSVDPSEVKMIRIAAQLHELGKITLSDDIVGKDIPSLSNADREKIRQFPLMGCLLVADIPQLEEVGSFIRHQMENYDGTGYPDHLLKDEIPLASRFLRGVNLLEDLEARCPGKTDEVLAEMTRSRGTLLDPRVTQLLLEYVTEHSDAAWLTGKRQVAVYELREGMVLASDLYTGGGIKLLPKDSVIHLSSIEKILQHHQFDPIINCILVYS